VAKQLQEKGYREFTTADLQVKDEGTGAISWRNPDDPGDPRANFKTRAEAQAWVDSYNRDYKTAVMRAIQDEQHRLAEDAMPKIRILQFAPVYDAMSETEQKIFDSIVKPYEQVDASGKIVGYSCDLNMAHRQFQSMVQAIISSQQPAAPAAPAAAPQAAPAPPARPALDMQSKGSGGGGKDMEPKDIAEAMKIFNEQSKKKG
jgi:hypothetical protein